MAAKRYWGDSMILAVETEGGTTITVGSLQNVEIIAVVSIERYFSADTIKIEDQKQHEFMVNVNVGIGAFNVDLIQQWLGGSGASSTGMVDTSDPQKFTITGTLTPTDGGTDLSAKVTGVTFEEMPIFSAARGEYLQKDLSGTGEDITPVTGAA